jgi:hypothetical protein
MGLITGQKFEGLRDPGIMRFTGGVTTTYFPTPREGIAKDAAETNPEGIAEPVPDEASGGAAVEATPLPPPVTSRAPIQPRPKPATP